MGGNDATDAFFELISSEIETHLAEDPPRPLSHWMLISDDKGITVCQLDDNTEGMAVDSVLSSHVQGGASAAAFLTARSDSVLAQVLVAQPRNSDLRRAVLRRESGGLSLGPWEPVL